MTDSYYSLRHLSDDEKLVRTSTPYYSVLNLFKSYIGISFLAIPYGYKQVGIYGATLSLLLILAINLYSVWLLLKTRDKWKSHRIQNLSDIAKILFGDDAKLKTDYLLIATELTICITYNIYFGEQID